MEGSVAFPATWSAKEREMACRTVQNVHRLLADARLLMAHERVASSFALSILALEEVGKVALALWGDSDELRAIDRRWTFHRKKQTAATMLLQADHAISETKRLLGDLSLDELAVPDPEKAREIREALTKSIAESRESRLAFYVALGATEKVKHLGFYFDEGNHALGLNAGELSSTDANDSLSEAARAVGLLSNALVVKAARSLYLLADKPLPPPDWNQASEATSARRTDQ